MPDPEAPLSNLVASAHTKRGFERQGFATCADTSTPADSRSWIDAATCGEYIVPLRRLPVESMLTE